jgi:hypothetical protein
LFGNTRMVFPSRIVDFCFHFDLWEE